MPTIEPLPPRRVFADDRPISHPVSATGRLLLALVDAEHLAEALGHPATGPLADLAEALRAGDGEPETEQIAQAVAAWLVGP